jgi:hypothetical protein
MRAQNVISIQHPWTYGCYSLDLNIVSIEYTTCANSQSVANPATTWRPFAIWTPICYPICYKPGSHAPARRPVTSCAADALKMIPNFLSMATNQINTCSATYKNSQIELRFISSHETHYKMQTLVVLTATLVLRLHPPLNLPGWHPLPIQFLAYAVAPCFRLETPLIQIPLLSRKVRANRCD